eukprot:CAMPEP_0202493774 /NCGR_PEP_ID=MMETSP1361-20130828/9983_1 /ASSEMBLY_ACC=CAM_ASM_000849 /TAXON_ID=210615 /ORGANISM="Staurosira complex sp., Strain CCMP2646" /LENGTH=513 /DNA_ID=CAMNT_0049124127 /DNA_START=69 /DNA_END=1610 /DNA_ORIENTATION=+
MPLLALITEASTGIGKELAIYHAKKGVDVILVYRRKEALEALKAQIEADYNVKPYVFTADLSKAGAAQALYDEVKKAGHEVNILINNAVTTTGFVGHGEIAEHKLGGDDVSMIMVNVVSLVALTYLFAADMVEQGGGRILNVESTAGFIPGPNQAIYLATMAFVNSFSQAVDQEMRGKGVCSTVLCPGYVETAKSLGLHSPRNGQSLSKGSSSLAFPTRVETSGDQATEDDSAKTRRINLMLDQAETVRFPFKKKLTLENLNLLPADIPIKDLTNTSLGNSLRKLSLAANRLSSIPPKLVICLPALKHLDLSQCELYQLPNEWNLPQLKRLNLSHNRLSEFPDETMLEGLPELSDLNMYGNKVSEIIVPQNTGLLSKLETLNLGYNDLAYLPDELDQLKALRTLKLMRNFLERIPMRVCNMDIKDIDVSSNPLIQPPIETCERGMRSMKRYYHCLQNEEQEERKALEKVQKKLLRRKKREEKNKFRKMKQHWKGVCYLASSILGITVVFTKGR